MNNTAWLLYNYFGKQSVKMLPNNYLVVHTRISEMHNVTQLTKGLETSQEPKEVSVGGRRGSPVSTPSHYSVVVTVYHGD